jgi:hypothetical protein
MYLGNEKASSEELDHFLENTFMLNSGTRRTLQTDAGRPNIFD